MSKLFDDCAHIELDDKVSKSNFSFKQRKWTEKDWDECLADEIRQAKEEEDAILNSVKVNDNNDGLFDFLKEDN